MEIEALVAMLLKLSIKRVESTVMVDGKSYEAMAYKVGQNLIRVDVKVG